MTPIRLLKTAITPALAELGIAGIPDTTDARRFLLAVALQESALRNRRQVTVGGEELGPASSFWQFEKNGGCKGVLLHRGVGPYIRKVCDDFNIEPNADALWAAMQYQDIVAACAARLLIYTLPGSLPTSAAQGWEQYLSAWRPGKPHPEKWAACWAAADETVKA